MSVAACQDAAAAHLRQGLAQAGCTRSLPSRVGLARVAGVQQAQPGRNMSKAELLEALTQHICEQQARPRRLPFVVSRFRVMSCVFCALAREECNTI